MIVYMTMWIPVLFGDQRRCHKLPYSGIVSSFGKEKVGFQAWRDQTRWIYIVF